MNERVERYNSDGNVVNLVALWDRVDRDERLLADLVRLFETEASVTLAEIRRAQAMGDLGRLARAAHAVKGAAGNLCGTECVQQAEQLERCARAGDMTAACLACARLERALARLVRAFRRMAPRFANAKLEASE
jgi:HPt (histidine-containing phosphotransfer) domain-containing protein